ncbi:unnamed protein product, partial [Oppiella nova]
MFIKWTVIVCLVEFHSTLGVHLPDIPWNSSNSIFRTDNQDHIIEVNKDNPEYEYDTINIDCPRYPNHTSKELMETFIIYNVPKSDYDSCNITNPWDVHMIVVCDKPLSNRYHRITF